MVSWGFRNMFLPLNSSTARQCFICFACNLSVLISAASFIWLEPLTTYLTSTCLAKKLTKEDLSWMISIVELGCFIALPSGVLADKYGRKLVLIMTGPLFSISWLLALLSTSKYVLYFVRILQGIGIGITFAVAPMYLAEISSAKIRGMVTGHFQTLWYLGILFVYVSGLNLPYHFYVGLCIFLPMMFMGLFMLSPESPYYYVMKDNIAAAQNSLQYLRGGEEFENELVEIKKSVQEGKEHKMSFNVLFKTKADRKAFIAVQIVGITRYMTGMPSLVNYATETFAQGSDGAFSKETLTILLGVLLTIIAILSAHLSDSLGRRYLLISSSVGCMISHILLGTYFYLQNSEKINMASHSWALYGGFIGFCFFSDIGLGSLIQTLQAEMFPSHTRGLGGGVTGSIVALASFINLKTFQPITDHFGLYMNFWIYAGISLVGTILIYVFVAETAGKTLSEIRADFQKNTTNSD